MSFQVSTAQQDNQIGLDATVYHLGRQPDCVATVWPALGFNCLTWQITDGSNSLDLLYLDPGQFSNGRPTRSGIPVLFPFPNRIRAGQFVWEGRTYQLPINDGSKQNAIHGFACRHPWRVIDQGSRGDEAWLTGEFHCSMDAPAELALWPADYCIRLTYRLSPNTLRLEAEIGNPDQRPLPFGLGYHPYFRIPFVRGQSQADCTVQVSARDFWQLRESLPTGRHLPLDAERDLNKPRSYASVNVDDVLSGVPNAGVPSNDLYQAALLTSPPGYTLRVLCSPSFRELVVFTPPHREAFCVEPYTCVTDAINLQEQGIDAGWRVLAPGQIWQGVVQMEVART